MPSPNTPITKAMKAKDLTQAKLAKAANLEANYVAQITRGLVPGAKARSALSEALNEDPARLWPEIARQEAAEAARQEAREDVARREEPIEVQPFNLSALGVEGE